MIRQVSVPAAEYVYLNGIEQYMKEIQIKETIPEHIEHVMKILYDNEVVEAQREYELNERIKIKKQSNARLLNELIELNDYCICGIKRKISEVD